MANDLFDTDLFSAVQTQQPQRVETEKKKCKTCNKFMASNLSDHGFGACEDLPRWLYLSEDSPDCKKEVFAKEFDGVAGFRFKSRG